MMTIEVKLGILKKNLGLDTEHNFELENLCIMILGRSKLFLKQQLSLNFHFHFQQPARKLLLKVFGSSSFLKTFTFLQQPEAVVLLVAQKK